MTLGILANDGAYFMSGNQLIPIEESQVAIIKERLQIIRFEREGISYARIIVDYTFFNPGPNKTILVGFEASPPSGDVVGIPKNGEHPYMSNFTVNLNDRSLTYAVALVDSENYYMQGKIQQKTEKELIGPDINVNEVDFFFVYHFHAKFKTGNNKLQHTYEFEMSGSISQFYSLDYILTAANRWANKQIDDFELVIDMGSNESFAIEKSFFDLAHEWQVENGKSGNISNKVLFCIETGSIRLKKKNFHPKGELELTSLYGPMFPCRDIFDQEKHYLPSELFDYRNCFQTADWRSTKILRNLPFAHHGYVFKTKYIQAFYEKQPWYKPNPKFIGKLSDLSQTEVDWIDTVDICN
ncbi:MAG: YARHG domain-containing protein [Flavobacteriaceae bacterium]|nr:YARHG domain-containing protein [Flavobacteriaceae bacterium]